MSLRTITILAFMIAVLLTVAGWQQVMIYKQPHLEKTAIWFPFLFIFRQPNEILRIILTLIQFPIFAGAFALGIRRWRIARALAVVLFSYAICVCAAFIILGSR